MEKTMRVKHFVPLLLLILLLVRFCTNTLTVDLQLPNHIRFGKKHFVLVHGAGHGAWCWYKLAALLSSTGHEVTTLDLTACGIDLTPVEQVNSFSDYVEPLIKFLTALPPGDRVILVGHSLGGVVISLAMERFPEKIAVAVYATAAMPGPSLSYLAIREKIMERSKLTGSQGEGAKRTDQFLASRLYQLSPPEDVMLAMSLARSSPVLAEELEFTEERYGSVPRVFIVSDQDRMVEEDVQRWMIKENPPNEVKVINGSDHMVMLSRPLELFSNLLQIAEVYS